MGDAGGLAGAVTDDIDDSPHSDGNLDDVAFIDPLWLSHHRRGEEERCIVVGGRHICRRCVWLWPMSIVALVLSLTVGLWPEELDALMLAMLPAPAAIELLQELRGRLAYDRVRQTVLMVPLAAAIGRGLARYLEDPGDQIFWRMALGYGFVCGYTALRIVQNRRWRAQH